MAVARVKAGDESPERRFDGSASLAMKVDLRTPKRYRTDQTLGNHHSIAFNTQPIADDTKPE